MKNISIRIIFSILFVVLPFFGRSQVKVSGTVSDMFGDPVAYADIYFPGTDTKTSTNSDGGFYIESDQTYDTLVVAQIDYDDEYVELKPGANYDLDIILNLSETEVVNLETVTATSAVKKYKKRKENPAYAIMRELWKRKRKNGLKKFPDYHYEEYEKIQFDLNNIDSAFMNRKVMNKFEFVFQNVDTSSITGAAYLPMFLNEAIYNVHGTNQPLHRERRDLIANKSSGFENNDIVANTVKNLYRDFDIYNNRVNFFQKAFVSPLARDGFNVYEYQLLDTLEIQDKSCYQIKYFPKRSNELTFKGDFCVDAATYAISEISLQSTKGINVNFVKDIYVELDFDLLNDSVFLPRREYYMIDMSLVNKKRKSKGIFAHRTISYDNYDFETQKDANFYRKRWDAHASGAYDKEDAYWDTARHEALSKDQNVIYATLDSLENVPKFQKIVKGIEVLSSGYYNIYNAIDIGNLYATFGYNDIEGVRMRAGARTFFSRNDMWRAAFYTAYGFKDRQVKYGAEIRKMFDRYNRFTIGIGTKRDVEQLGAQLTLADGIMTRSFASSSIIGSGSNTYLSSVNKTNAFAAIDPLKNVTIRLDGTYQEIKAANPSLFDIRYIQNGDLKNSLTDTKLSLSITARPGAKFSRYGLDRYEHSSLAPTIMLRYSKGFDGLFNSQFNYDKLQFYFYKPFLVGSIGRSDITLEAGKIFQSVPLSLLSVIPANQSYGFIPGTFSLLNYYDFVSDTYTNLNIDHHFNGRLLSFVPWIKKLNLRTVVFARGTYGTISDEAIAMNASNINYTAPDKNIYYEYGFGIENIGWGNIRPLRVNFNFRGNYFDLPDAEKFKITVGMDFSF